MLGDRGVDHTWSRHVVPCLQLQLCSQLRHRLQKGGYGACLWEACWDLLKERARERMGKGDLVI